ncbi:iron complex outermembrane receptor protein [Sphingopyxis panaciterrae]|uniref:TonB-dependent receptor domain-containing protein n=1 Tax=Sphingopyxis panaciterrae TaxID=363841 RepID=UPI0014208662|nr:TonB-dependent receptor [Sphingopyxis panaciterrae]NIJ36700.1 iron complex outermembrane receptor protein [Sphingopyxis panaciterrae]
MNKSHLLVGAAAFAVAMSASQPAFAQDTIGSANCADLNNDGVCDSNASSGDAIVVTGSRIKRRNEFNSPDPIQVISPEIGQKQGQNQLQDLLQSSPIAQGSIQITSSISNGFVTNGGADAQTVSLRGLGAERTLVLLNGRRAGPAGVRGAVASFDLNVLPLSVVRQVEVLKTGASSIYGSDAVAGVVNILTKDNADGFELGGFTSIPQHGGGEIYDFNISYGKRFDRGHILMTVDYFQQQNLKRRDRDFLFCQEDYLKREADGSRADIVDFRTGKPACFGTLGNMILTDNDFTGLFGEGPLEAPNGLPLFAGQYGSHFGQVGVDYNTIPGVTAPSNFFGLDFDGPSRGALNQFEPLEQAADVFSKVSRVTGYLDASYELTDNVEVYTELLFNNRKSYNNGFQQINVFQFTGNSLLPSLTVNPNTGGLSLNPNYPGAFCTTSDFNCVIGDAGDPFNTEFSGNFLLRPLVLVKSDFSTDVDYYRGVLGFRGDFDGFLSGWNWDVYTQYSRSNASYTQSVVYEDARFTQDFRTRSCVGMVTPVTGRPCMDIDWTDPRVLRGDFTQAERDFLMGEETGHTRFTQWSGEATLSGNLLTLPAGDVGVAFGVQIRRDQIRDVPGEVTLAGNAALRTSSGITAGRTVSKEIFGEIQIPLIHDTPLIQRLTLSGAGRYTHVDATRRDGATDSFSDVTWKAGLDWEVTDWLRFRGTWGTSFRAPALFELFLENQTGFQPQQDIDICRNLAAELEKGTINQRIFDNCTAAGIPDDFAGATGSATVTTAGGLGTLRPETSTAKTASVILTPDLSGVLWGGLRTSLAVDYFDIRVKNEITQLGARNIVVGCYNSEFYPNEPLCDLITRANSGPEVDNITDIEDSYINISDQRNRGIDVTLRVNQDLGNLGALEFRAQMTWQTKDTIELFPGTLIDDNGEAGDPKWVGDFSLSWEKGPWTIFYGLDVTGGTSDLQDLLDTQGGSACRTSIYRPGGSFCPDVRLSPTFYHSMSVTREIDDKFAITLGVSNMFDTAPPRFSTVLGGITAIGNSPAFGTQYDYFGRRVFMNVRGKF